MSANQQVQIYFDDADTVQGLVLANGVTNVYCFLEPENSGGGSPSSITLPTLSNGILYFEDQEHVVEIHDWVENIIDTSSYEMLDMLDYFESQFTGFTSFRTDLESTFNLRQGGLTDQDMLDYFTVDFIHDEILKSFLNQNRMIGIGDSVFYMKKENMIIGVDGTDNNLIAGLAALPDSIDVLGSGGIIALIGNPQDFEIYSPFIEKFNTYYDQIYVDAGVSYRTTATLHKKPCEIYEREVKVSLYEKQTEDAVTNTYYYDPTWYDVDAIHDLTIYWGDGSSPEVIIDYEGESITHDFPSTGEYDIITKYEFFDRFGNMQVARDTIYDVVINIACTHLEASTHEYTISGSYQMQSVLFVQHNVVFKQVGAKTRFFEKNRRFMAPRKNGYIC